MVAQGFRQGRARDCSQNMNSQQPSRKDFIEARKGLTWYSNGFTHWHTARKVLFEARKGFDSHIDHNPCMRVYSTVRILHKSGQSGRRKAAQGLDRGAQGSGARHNKHKHARKLRKAAQGLAQG